MKQRKRFSAAILILAVLSLVSCSTVPEQAGSMATVENIFTQPKPEETGAPETPTNPPEPDGLGTIRLSPAGEPLQDSVGLYRLYEGGEMHLPYVIETTGTIADQGVGILLFLDGRPQPYKTAENDTYQYLHTFYPAPGEAYTADICFSPVTGQAGDALELYAATILNPDYTLADGDAGFLYTTGSAVSFTRLKYNATPSSEEPELRNDRITALNVSYIDTEFLEISGWSDRDLMEKMESHLSVNGVDDTGKCMVYGVSAGEPVKLRYEVWGSPYVQYGLVIFVDNEPVFPADGNLIPVTVKNGQKTVIEAELDMTGFDGESVVYGMLVPRNYRTSEIPTQVFLDNSSTFFLVSDEE